MSGMQTKQTVKHRKGCTAIQAVIDGHWSNPWWLTGAYVRRDTLGRRTRGGGVRWIVAECNSTSCLGTLLIREDSILDKCPNGGTA